MYYSAATLVLFTASMASTTLGSISAKDIKNAVGDGCRNHVDFKGRFRTEAGTTCGSCSFCEGSTVNSLFIPQAKDTCIQCTKGEDTCSMFEVITSFENAWTMKYTTLAPSALAPTSDPKKVTMLGSNDLVTWEDLHSTELTFLDREQKAEFIINNENKYKHYSVQFERSGDVMNIGKYGLVEAYTKGCTSEIHESITGDLVPIYTDVLGHEFKDKEELQVGIIAWISAESDALYEYGDIKAWRTGKVTNMMNLFNNKKTFNGDVSQWDTSAVTTMNQMFASCPKFNINLNGWNVSAVTDMGGMFAYASEFNHVLCWDMTGVTAPTMFKGAGGGRTDSNC